MDQPEGDVRPLSDAAKETDPRSLRVILEDAYDEWEFAPFTQNFAAFLLERLAAAGFVIGKAGD